MEVYAIIAGVILLVGILFFFALSGGKKYRTPSEAKNYEKIREKLTLRELGKEPEVEEDSETELEIDTDFNAVRLVKKMVYVILLLFVGGTVIDTFGEVMIGTSSPFYNGLTLIGWTVDTSTNTIVATSGTGIMAILGILGIAMILVEFVRIKV